MTNQVTSRSSSPPPRDPLATVIITTCNSPATLQFVLLALSHQGVLPHEVIIADDGSTAETLAMLQSIAPDLPFALRHVWQPHNGFRVARNRNNAIFAAQTPKLLFLDQDTIPVRDWMASHLHHLNAETISLGYKTDLPAGLTLSNDDIQSGRYGELISAEAWARLKRTHRKFLGYAALRRVGLSIKNKPSLGAGNFAAMKSSLSLVNGFDEDYQGWGQEDDDLGRRLYLGGWRPCIAVKTAVVCHVPHPLRHPSQWKQSANLNLYHARRPMRCRHGLNQHPHPDVIITALPCRLSA